MSKSSIARAVFLACLIFSASTLPWATPPVALLLGIAFGMTFEHPFAKQSRKASTWLLQFSVVGLGFSMNLQQVLRAGRSGFIYTLFGIGFALSLGWILGKVFGVERISAYLISVGTAICGGSAIAAVAPVVDASSEQLSVSMGTVFLLNAAGLLIFPPLGHRLHLTQAQFGLWAALAIHDTSSVVAAGSRYGSIALAIATTVKLARALWIVPVTLGTAAVWHKKESDQIRSIKWPWFILFFLGAAVMNTYVHSGDRAYRLASSLGHIGLTVTLFLIGTGITRTSIKAVGVRPLSQGILLWMIVALVSLTLIHRGWIFI